MELNTVFDIHGLVALDSTDDESRKNIPAYYDTEEFKTLYTYHGPLGCDCSDAHTTFTIWSPLADRVTLNLFTDCTTPDPYQVKELLKGARGTWSIDLHTDLRNSYYTYTVTHGAKVSEIVDPYARAVGVDGLRAMVLDLQSTNPEGWDNHERPELLSPSDAIIYEVHVRDLSISPSSGIRKKGKFLGLTESGTTNADGHATGLDHIKELGVTHVQLLPIYDFDSVSEDGKSDPYNWGYDPMNYNAPEGSYATDPYDGAVRIRELKEAVMAIHNKGMRVVMDVVYNHTSRTRKSHLNLAVPKYFHRTSKTGYTNGSGCGNETASERLMVRRYILDSVKYWAKEYRLDGFRFDLMGIHDIETMKMIEEELHAIDDSLLLYGEGWTGDASPLPENERLVKRNISKVKRIGAFNDDIRDSIKGHVFKDKGKGIVSGEGGMEEGIKFGVTGAVYHPQVSYGNVFYSDHPWANVTSQSINYVAAHDNHTLFDKLQSVNHSVPEEEIVSQNKLADAIVMTCQGIPFIHAGSEFLRTKHGDENSYRSGDRVNQLDWELKTRNIDVFRYYQGLIALRKSRKAFRMNLAQDVQNNIIFYGTEQNDSLRLRDRNVVAYLLTNHANGDDEGTVLVAINGNKDSITLDLPVGQWKVLVDKDRAGSEPFGIVTAPSVTIPGTSILVLTSTKVVEARTGLAVPFESETSRRRIFSRAPLTALVAYIGSPRRKVS